jgi:hypothetical protein
MLPVVMAPMDAPPLPMATFACKSPLVVNIAVSIELCCAVLKAAGLRPKSAEEAKRSGNQTFVEHVSGQ